MLSKRFIPGRSFANAQRARRNASLSRDRVQKTSRSPSRHGQGPFFPSRASYVLVLIEVVGTADPCLRSVGGQVDEEGIALLPACYTSSFSTSGRPVSFRRISHRLLCLLPSSHMRPAGRYPQHSTETRGTDSYLNSISATPSQLPSGPISVSN